MSRILIVEDSLTQARRLQFILEERGHEVTVAPDGHAGFEQARTSQFDMVLADIQMPRVSGHELCQMLKADTATGSIPVILLTALDDPFNIIHALAAGADCFINKPYESADLVRRVETVLAARHAMREPESRAGVEVGFLGRTLTINSSREQILAFLIASFEDIIRTNKGLSSALEDAKIARWHLNQALLEAATGRDRLDVVLKSIASGVLVTDQHDNIILMNQVAGELLAVPLAGIVGKHADVLSSACLQAFGKKITAIRTKAEAAGKFELVIENDGNGSPRIVKAIPSAIYDKTGVFHGTVTVLEDVTEERELERMKTEFFSMAAHELRTPLTAIQGFSEILLTRSASEERSREMLLTINAQAKALGSIVNDLLDLARIESGKGLKLAAEATDLAEIARTALETFRSLNVAHEYVLRKPAEPLLAECDPEKIRQVFQNLISNATKYSPKGGRIEVDLSAYAAGIECAVKDEGIGMTPEQLSHLFEKFFRADASNTSVGGTGLGLAIVKAIVEQHGGNVRVESEAGQGTRVIFSLPLRQHKDGGMQS